VPSGFASVCKVPISRAKNARDGQPKAGPRKLLLWPTQPRRCRTARRQTESRLPWKTINAARPSPPQTGWRWIAPLLAVVASSLAAEVASKKSRGSVCCRIRETRALHADAFAAAFEAYSSKPSSTKLVSMPHTYQVRDFCRSWRTMGAHVISDCIGSKYEEQANWFLPVRCFRQSSQPT